MISTIIFSFIAGVWFGNGIPHFIRGITKNTYPSVFGQGPIQNLVVGWVALATTPLFLYLAQPMEYPGAAWIAGAIGVLAIGLFHAGPGAFGRK